MDSSGIIFHFLILTMIDFMVSWPHFAFVFLPSLSDCLLLPQSSPLALISVYQRRLYIRPGHEQYEVRTVHSYWHQLPSSLPTGDTVVRRPEKYFYPLPNRFCQHSVITVAFITFVNTVHHLPHHFRSRSLYHRHTGIFSAISFIIFFLPPMSCS